jgi:hypothetical protein
VSDADVKDHAGHRRRFRRAARPEDTTSAGDDPALALQAELTLLREENARLQAAQYRPADLGTALEQIRALPELAQAPSGASDEEVDLLTRGVVMRAALLQVCGELGRAVAAAERQLRAAGEDAPPARSHARHAA